MLSRWKAAQLGQGLQLRPSAATRKVTSHPHVLGTFLVLAQKALFSQKSLRTEMIGPRTFSLSRGSAAKVKEPTGPGSGGPGVRPSLAVEQLCT